MKTTIISFLILIAALLLVTAAIDCVMEWHSPEFKRDLERLREQRRARKAARR